MKLLLFLELYHRFLAVKVGNTVGIKDSCTCILEKGYFWAEEYGKLHHMPLTLENYSEKIPLIVEEIRKSILKILGRCHIVFLSHAAVND